MLDEMLGKKCAILAGDYAAQNFLRKNYPQLEEHFVFPRSFQQVFGDYMHNNHPGVKLYNISVRNSFGAEAVELGNCDYFMNPRELYRIFLRTGVDPSTRRGIKIGAPCGYERCERYKELLTIGGWRLNGEAEEQSFTENGREYKALICHNLGQVKGALEKMDNYDVIRVIG